jgi:cytochrome P450
VSFRTAHQDDRLGRFHIPGGSHMLMLHYLTHRHPLFWPDATLFDPERFTRQASAGRAKHAYYPFGAGQHMCIGKHFAMLEMKLILATIMRDYRLQLAEGSVVEMNPRATLRSRYGIPLLLSARASECRTPQLWLGPSIRNPSTDVSLM